MSLYKIGRMCMKVAGRDAGKHCVVLSAIENNAVLVDGETRRRKVNLKHLEPLDKEVAIKADASHSEVAKAFEKLGLKALETKAKKAAARPRQVRKAKASKAVAPKPKAKAAKKEAKPKPAPKKAEEKPETKA